MKQTTEPGGQAAGRLQRWSIYYSDGEFARLLGDPLLGIVEAETIDDAERLGRALPTYTNTTAGVWAVPAK